MTNLTPQPASEYLAQLDAALADVEPGVRADIVAGIREEFEGLDAAAVRDRIEALGDPAFIAAEARSALPIAQTGSPAQTGGVAQLGPAVSPPGRTLSLLAVLLLIVGAFVLPVIGPIAGLVWVSFSAAWSRREKLIAWLVPVGLAIVVAVIAVYAQTMVPPEASVATTNPIIPPSGWHLAILGPYVLFPIVGIVLLVRASRRGWVPRSASRRASAEA